MLFVTGDTHSKILPRFTEYVEELTAEYDLTKDDYVLILGDFGGIWYTDADNQSKEEERFDIMHKFPWTTLFIDGNHENFDRLRKYPVKKWHGGKVHEIRPDILHLMRGEIYDICGKKCFCFGGARSHDIRDGVLKRSELDKINQYLEAGLHFRVEHLSWWKEEMPNKKEFNHGLKSLKKVNNKVDYIFTHDGPSSMVRKLTHKIPWNKQLDQLNEYLEQIRKTTTYDKWVFAHYHINDPVSVKHTVLHEGMIKVE